MENSQQPTGQSAPSAPTASTGAGHSHAHTSSAHSHAGGPRRSFGQRGGGRGGFVATVVVIVAMAVAEVHHQAALAQAHAQVVYVTAV